jgi:NH3-dependent NAD+ synthetase
LISQLILIWRAPYNQLHPHEITRTGLSRAVVGLSGGLDSALSCFLAAEALGAQNVLAVRMPYKTSSQESLDHAKWSLTPPVCNL